MAYENGKQVKGYFKKQEHKREYDKINKIASAMYKANKVIDEMYAIVDSYIIEGLTANKDIKLISEELCLEKRFVKCRIKVIRARSVNREET